jgi:GDP-D-mannose 3',5'-epimerase
MKKALVCGGGGFIGSHLIKRLKKEGYWVIAADIKLPEYSNTSADVFKKGDLRDIQFVKSLYETQLDEVYQLAADMGGAGYLFTGLNDANVMHNSTLINLNVLQTSVDNKVSKIFYSSSACVYPDYNQHDPNNPICTESTVYPAQPDSEYGWEKLFGERLYIAFAKNYNIDARIGRFHNVFGPEGTYIGGREKSPAALCRKVAQAKEGESIEVWGDGLQTRSFLYIDECVEAVMRFMNSNFSGPVNIGSDKFYTINQLANIIIGISGKNLSIKNIPGPLGVRGRTSDNTLYESKIGWKVSDPIEKGLKKTYDWIEYKVNG